MDNSQLAGIMLEWEATQRKADELAAQIKAAVLEIGKTQVVGNVRATFSAGRRTFDYRAAVEAAESAGLLEPGALAPFTEMVINYAAAAKALQLEAPISSQSEPSVTLKLA